MNFIQDIMNISRDDEIFVAKKNASKLLYEICRYRYKIKEYIDAEYKDFLPAFNNNEYLRMEGEKLINEIEMFLGNIKTTKEDLSEAAREFNSYIEDLHELTIEMKSSNKIFKIEECFERIVELKNFKKHGAAMSLLGHIKTLMDDPTDKIFNKLACYQAIKLKYHYETEILLHDLRNEFERLVEFTEKSFHTTKVITIRIEKEEDKLCGTIIALHKAKYNPRKLCNFLLENVFEPIIKKPTSLEIDDQSKYIQITISYSLADLSVDLRPNYETAFSQIKVIFESISCMNVPITDSLKLFHILSENIKEKLLELLINECLTYSVPNTMDEMNESNLVSDIIDFHNYLVKINIINDETDRELIKYAEQIGILFRNRFCTNIVDTAIGIMQQYLHDMVLVVDSVGPLSDTNNTTAFPRCMISKSTKELIALIEKIMQQAKNTGGDVEEQLLLTITTILNRYLIEVPKKHEKLLLNIPQQTALFHNNCMYLAHWLYHSNVIPIDSATILIKSLKDLGLKHFLHQVNNQRNQLIEILHGFDLSDAVSEMGLNSQHTIEQCLRQLDILKNVWQTVLPEIVYNKTMSNLVNDFCSEVIKKIMRMEDIPSVVANELVEICQNIIQAAPTIFQDPSTISVNVKSWVKLTHLKMILRLSLGEIAEQWADGKGPLSLSFDGEELKYLIKALFQNTDRRARILSLI